MADSFDPHTDEPTAWHADALQHATALARAAGAAILAVKDEARSSRTLKSDESPVTLADVAADRVIREGLAGWPGLVVTEESFRAPHIGRHAQVWCVDPLDGTEDFVCGRDDYVVQIGLVEDGRPRLGVVYAPESGIVWRGIVGGAAERIAKDGVAVPLDVRQRPLSTRPRIVVSRSHRSEALDALVHSLGADVLRRGSVGLKVGMILDDEADCYLTASRHIKVWDTCAPAAVLLAAGGVARSIDETALQYGAALAHGAGMAAYSAQAARALSGLVRARLGALDGADETGLFTRV